MFTGLSVVRNTRVCYIVSERFRLAIVTLYQEFDANSTSKRRCRPLSLSVSRQRRSLIVPLLRSPAHTKVFPCVCGAEDGGQLGAQSSALPGLRGARAAGGQRRRRGRVHGHGECRV